MAKDSFELVLETIGRFLADPQPRILAIKGEWGVGKTYLWNKAIEDKVAVAECEEYAYVSLFGVRDIAELRRLIFAKRRTKGPAPDPISRLKKQKDRALSFFVRHTEPKIPYVSLKNTELWATSIEESSLSRLLVCIDDFERREDALSPSALLGFITQLRDEKKCKVALLYNDLRPDKSSGLSKSLADYREKVFDWEVLLQPTVSDCYRIVFPDSRFDAPNAASARANPLLRLDSRTLEQIFQDPPVANIRVLRKTREALEYFALEMEGKYPKLWPQFIRQVAKISCLHFLHANKFPITDLKNFNKVLQRIAYSKKDSEETNSLREKYLAATALSFQPLPSDVIAIDYFTKGFVDWSTYKSLLDSLESQENALRLGAEYHACWNLLWNNFQASEDVFLDTLSDFVISNVDLLDFTQVSQSMNFIAGFRTLTEREEAALRKSEDSYVRTATLKDTLDLSMSGVDQDTIARIRSSIETNRPKLSIGETLSKLTKPSSYDPADIAYLKPYSKEDLLAWMKTDPDPDLLSKIKKFREYFASPSGESEEVGKMDWALREMAKLSEANKKRVSVGVGLKLEDDKEGA